MSAIRRVWKDMFERAYDSLFHPSVQWFRVLKKDYRVGRYPAVASEPVDHEANGSDFKTAYRDSIHFIRYRDFPPDLSVKYFIADPLNETPTEKLLRFKFLKPEDVNNAEAVATATKQFEDAYSQPLTQKIWVNDYGYSTYSQLAKSNCSRESIANFVREQFEELNDINSHEPMFDLNEVYKPEINEKVHLSIHQNDPVTRQIQIDCIFILDKIAAQNKQRGYQQFFQGNPNYWHVLDNSFSTGKILINIINYQKENIRLVQSAVADNVSNTDPNALEQVHNKNLPHTSRNVPFPIRTQYYE